MSPRFTSVLISVFAGSTFLLTSAADAAPKKSKADVAKEQAEQEQAQKEQAVCHRSASGVPALQRLSPA